MLVSLTVRITGRAAPASGDEDGDTTGTERDATERGKRNGPRPVRAAFARVEGCAGALQRDPRLEGWDDEVPRMVQRRARARRALRAAAGREADRPRGRA